MVYQRILTAINQVSSDDKALLVAQAFSQKEKAEITLLHAVKRMPSFTFYYSLVSFDALEVRYGETIKNKLDYIAAVQNIRCATLVDYGSMQTLVERHCEMLKPDLLVIKKGHAAKVLLQKSPCDMLIVCD